MKYRMLIKPLLNAILQQGIGRPEIYTAWSLDHVVYVEILDKHLPSLIAQGIIEEIQEPVWTDFDLMEFLGYYEGNPHIIGYRELLADFKKEKGLK
jgi:hypothetical protein